MVDCPNLEKCAFFKEYQTNKDLELSLRGFIRIYCKGDKMDECVRKKIKQNFSIEKVPVNMMPNGHHLRGTNKAQWDPEVIDFTQKL